MCVASDLLNKMLGKIGMRFMEGRSAAAPELPKEMVSSLRRPIKALLVKKPKLKKRWGDSMAEQKGCRIIRDPDPGNQCGGVPPQFSKSFLLDLQSRVIDR